MQERTWSTNAKPQNEPIQLTGVWRMESTAQADAILGGTSEGFVYRRNGHPNADTLTAALRKLHHAEEAIVTSQGMSALSVASLALLKPGDRVVLGQPVYGRTSHLIKHDLARWGVQHQDVEATDYDAWSEALERPTRLVILETITNPRLSVPDLERIASLAHHRCGDATQDGGCVVLVDNTFATPVLCQPMAFGADLVMESLSKFVCGHADVMLGFLCGHRRIWSQIQSTMVSFGMASSPLDCWLTSRGLASLQVRMSHAAASTMQIARMLDGHRKIAQLDYPGLLTHPNHDVATSQFHGCYGNMLTFRLHGGVASANRFIHAVSEDIPFCPSLGEAQTTLSHPCSTSHRSYSTEQLDELGIDGGTIRLSVGLEPSQGLADTILRALN
jgi:cystathionine beta-lyase/cystathionine gamma-synthase